MRDYTKIEAWRLADDLTVAIYEKSRMFPREELYGLTSQLRRAAASVPANIVEGSARRTKRDYLHFLYISRGSLAEAQYFVHLAHRLGYLTDAAEAELRSQSRQTFACLHGLIQAVEKEAGKISTFATTITTLLVLGLVRVSTCHPFAG
jgi:four helix bundle protein